MHRRLHLLPLYGFVALLASLLWSAANAASDYRVIGPFVHENLAVYMITGSSRPGPVPLTLSEALATGVVSVSETGQVSELRIENFGDREVFIQSGEIVKGGQQDRVLTSSLLLAPRSGSIPIGSLCVEQGRWSQRGEETDQYFSSADFAIPSRRAKLAMQTPDPLGTLQNVGAGTAHDRQGSVWDLVASTQQKLAERLNGAVRSEQSPTSLQLSLESSDLKTASSGYVDALIDAGGKDTDIVGYAFAINGKINAADIYPSNGLFKKLWPKLLTASAIEAIAEQPMASESDLPASDAVLAFLQAAESGTKTRKLLTGRIHQEAYRSPDILFLQTSRDADEWIHRNYIASN